MVVHAVMRAWLVSRQQFPSQKQQLPEFLTKKAVPHRRSPDRQEIGDDVVDDDAAINVEKRDDIVPIRRGITANPPDDEGFWTSHLFWKGIVLGVLAVVLVKTVLAIQTPFGIDWYGF